MECPAILTLGFVCRYWIAQQLLLPHAFEGLLMDDGIYVLRIIAHN